MEISIIVVCLILSAFFSGMEIAFVSSNKVFLGIEKMQPTFNSRILAKLTENPSKFIATLLIQTILSTFIILITSEFLPKVLFQIYANKLIVVLAVPAYVSYKIFYL